MLGLKAVDPCLQPCLQQRQNGTSGGHHGLALLIEGVSLLDLCGRVLRQNLDACHPASRHLGADAEFRSQRLGQTRMVERVALGGRPPDHLLNHLQPVVFASFARVRFVVDSLQGALLGHDGGNRHLLCVQPRR